MIENSPLATFLVFEEDPLVHMDILDMLSRGFAGWPLVILEALEHLPEKLAGVDGHRIIVSSADAGAVASYASKASLPDNHVAAVLIAEDTQQQVHEAFPMSIVQRPFKSEQLLSAVRTSLEHLLGHPS